MIYYPYTITTAKTIIIISILHIITFQLLIIMSHLNIMMTMHWLTDLEEGMVWCGLFEIVIIIESSQKFHNNLLYHWTRSHPPLPSPPPTIIIITIHYILTNQETSSPPLLVWYNMNNRVHKSTGFLLQKQLVEHSIVWTCSLIGCD